MPIDIKNRSGRVINNTIMFSGTGTVILHPGAQIRAYSVIEMADGYLELKENAILGFFTMVQGTGNIVIGRDSIIGPHCTLLASYHEMSNDPSIQRKLVRSTLTICDNVWSGANVVFNYGITIHNNAVIGANSFVNKDVEAGTVVAGSPVKFIRLTSDNT